MHVVGVGYALVSLHVFHPTRTASALDSSLSISLADLPAIGAQNVSDKPTHLRFIVNDQCLHIC
jgi:hypothetical protein